MNAAARAEAVVLAWARRYTARVPDAVAERRLLELTSDCWEQRRRGREVGAHPLAVATSMVVRTLAGIPADLAWRHQALAVHRGRPLHEGGRPMGRWIKDNWWVVLGGLTAALTTVLGIGLPFEDRTLGAAIGGVVIALLGLTGLAGVAVRGRPGRRRVGDLMIAAGQLPWIPFFWAVVPPILALVVIIAAFMDLADAESTGNDSPVGPPTGGNGVTHALLGLLVVAVVAAVVVGDVAMVLAVPTPLAIALLVHLLLGRRLAAAPLLRTAAVLLATPALWFIALGTITELEDGYAIEGGWELAVEAVGIAMLVVGIGLAIGGTFRERRARPV